MIEVTNLVKKYGNHTAVDSLSFKVEKGQVYGFLGPNGAGKSTTMNIITGYIGATEGTVIVNGYDIFEEPEKAKKSIGYLPELPPLYVDMTPYEYLKFAADLKKLPKAEKEKMIQDAMEMTQIKDVSNRLIKKLSKGYKQRVGLAQAILGYPEIIILDEPTVGLDPKQIIEIRDLIKSLSKKHTVILSSHILSEVSAICDYVMIISKGKLVASDTPANLSKNAAAANILDITLQGDKEKIENIVKGFKEIQDYSVSNNPDGTVHVTVKSGKDADVRMKLNGEFFKAECMILEMKSSEATLEEVFLELTQLGKDESVIAEELTQDDIKVESAVEVETAVVDDTKTEVENLETKGGESDDSSI